MKECIQSVVGAVKELRRGDRIIVDNEMRINTSVYRKSAKDKPYMLIDIDGGFKITLIELILIVAAVSVGFTLFIVHLRNKICKKLSKKSSKN